MDLTYAEWATFKAPFRPRRRGGMMGAVDRGKIRERRFNGVFWILRTGAPWHDCRVVILATRPVIAASSNGNALGCSPNCSETGRRLRDRGKLDLSESFIDASFSSAKKGALLWPYSPRQRQQNHGDQRRPWSSSRRATWPALRRMKQNSSNPLERDALAETPARLIGDRAYDSDPLDVQIRERFGVQLVAPHNSTRTRKATQDGRVLRRYRRRWKIERLFAWLHNFRRVVIRWEYYPENFLGMVQLACAVILLRYL